MTTMSASRIRSRASGLARTSGGSTVVGYGHDSRDVGAVALQAPEERGKTRPPADRHDSRSACEVALGVQHLEHAVATGDERRHDAAHQAPDPEAGEEQSHDPHDHRSNRPLDAGTGQPKDDRDVVGAESPVEVHEEDRRAQPQDGDSHEGEQEPSLDVHPRVQPPREANTSHRSSSRWKTLTDPSVRSSSRLASSSANTMER